MPKTKLNKVTNTTINKKINKKTIKHTLKNMSVCNESNNNNSEVDVTAAPKRSRDALQNSYAFENVMKTPRLSTNDSPFKLLDLVDKRFEKITDVMKKIAQESEAHMKTIIQESEDRMLRELDKRFDEIKRDISSITDRVDKLETVAADIVSLKSEVNNLKTQLQRQENSLVASDLRINGIPYMKDEVLFEVFDSICYALNISTPAVKSIYRLQNHNNKDQYASRDAVIMVKLFSPYDKNFVLKSIANFRKAHKTKSLYLDHIGYNSDRPFYVNENLTTLNYKILQAATKFKNAGRLKSVFAMRGIVYVKFDGNEQAVRIESIEELEGFFRGDEQPNNDD